MVQFKGTTVSTAEVAGLYWGAKESALILHYAGFLHFSIERSHIGLTISLSGNERGKRHPLLDTSRYCTHLKLPQLKLESAAFSVATVAPLICQTMSQVGVKYTRKKTQQRILDLFRYGFFG